MVERQVKPSVVFRWDFVHSLNVLNPKTSAVQKNVVESKRLCRAKIVKMCLFNCETLLQFAAHQIWS